MVNAVDLTLQLAPDAFDAVRVSDTITVLSSGVADYAVGIRAAQVPVARMLVCRNVQSVRRHRLMHKTVQRGGVGILDHAGDDITLTANRTYDPGFSGRPTRTAITFLTVG